MAAKSSSWGVFARFHPKVIPPSSGLTSTVRSPLSQVSRSRPVWRKRASQLVAGGVTTVEFFSHAFEPGINSDKKVLWWQTTKRFIPQPFVPHSADRTRAERWFCDTAKDSSNHVAVLKRSDESIAQVRIVPEPMKQLREAPFGRIDATAPVNDVELAAAGGLRDEGSLAPGAVVAPEIVGTERFQFFPHGNHARACRVYREGRDLVSRNLGGSDSFLHG